MLALIFDALGAYFFYTENLTLALSYTACGLAWHCQFVFRESCHALHLA